MLSVGTKPAFSPRFSTFGERQPVRLTIDDFMLFIGINLCSPLLLPSVDAFSCGNNGSALSIFSSLHSPLTPPRSALVVPSCLHLARPLCRPPIARLLRAQRQGVVPGYLSRRKGVGLGGEAVLLVARKAPAAGVISFGCHAASVVICPFFSNHESH